MNSKTKPTTSKDNKEFDILEEQFLSDDCDINDIPLPKQELKDYEFEIREVMKSGCNRQIAEHSLLKCNIVNYLNESKNAYIKARSNIKEEVLGKISTYIDNIKDKKSEQNKNDSYVIEFNKSNEDEGKKYEEEADEIMEEKNNEFENNDDLLKEKENIKKYCMFLFKEFSEEKKDENFDEYKKIYKDKRDALLEAALRLVKKIVNDENEYNKFYEDYFKKIIKK